VQVCSGLEVFINSFIKDIGLKPFVLLEGLTVPLTPGHVDGLVVITASLSSILPPASSPACFLSCMTDSAFIPAVCM